MFAPLGVVLAGLLLLAPGCSGGGVPTQATCFSTPECPPSHECGGGLCVAYTACTTDADCGGGKRCGVGACRASCTSNDQCEQGLECNLALFQCLAAPNPPPPPVGGAGGAGPGPGGSGGTAGPGGAPPGGAAGSAAGAGGAPPSGGSGGQVNPGGSGGMSGGAAGSSGGSAGAAGAGTCGTTWPSFPSYMNNNGSVTLYDFSMGSNCGDGALEPGVNNKCVNCSFRVTGVGPDTVSHVYTGEGRYFAAMNTADFRSAAACGACVEVTRDGNRRVVATVVDQCPSATNDKCRPGHIDLSREAFRLIASEQEGYVGTGNGGTVGSISWRYVPCPVPASQNVTVRLKEQNNEYYTAIRVQDHVFPIASVSIKGANATRDGANHWLVGSGNQSPGPWPVRVTDVNGWTFDASVSLGSGDVSTGRRATCN